jgi:hypothetical protein
MSTLLSHTSITAKSSESIVKSGVAGCKAGIRGMGCRIPAQLDLPRQSGLIPGALSTGRAQGNDSTVRLNLCVMSDLNGASLFLAGFLGICGRPGHALSTE